MKYNLQLFKENNLKCNWITLYVGRQLGLISHSVVAKYALKTIEKNDEFDNELILELAWNLEEAELDMILENLIYQIHGSQINEESIEWDIEKRKWRYCVLSDICKRINDEQGLYEEVEEIFSLFECPSDMNELFRNISDKHFYSTEKEDDILTSMKKIISEFLETELRDLNTKN